MSNKRCPNSQCNSRDDFGFPPTAITERLFRFSIICPVCTISVNYFQFEAHELFHHECKLCKQALSSGWAQIASHYSSSCPKALVECRHCVFKFSQSDYMSHSCQQHYRLRAFEAALFGLTFVFLAINGKMFHRLPIDECLSTRVKLQTLMTDFLINHLVVFWAVAMHINMFSVQRKQKMDVQFRRKPDTIIDKAINRIVQHFEYADTDYLIKFSCCCVFMLTVAFRQNQNRLSCAAYSDQLHILVAQQQTHVLTI